MLQSGAPPNWHGVILVLRSAEIVVVVRAKMQSSGDAGGSAVGLQDVLVHPQLGIAEPQRREVGDDALAVDRPQPLGRHLAHLRRVQAHPDLLRVRLRRPELQELLEVARPFDLLPRHRAVHGDLVAGDVLEDAIVGGRRPPGVVLGLQAVDRHDNLQPPQAAPADRDLADGARHELRVDAARGQDRQQRVELAVADERFAADDRQVQRAMAIHEREHAVDERLALEVAQLAQPEVAAQVIVAVRVAAGAVQRALARDLDRERGRVAAEYPSPGRQDPFQGVLRPTL